MVAAALRPARRAAGVGLLFLGVGTPLLDPPRRWVRHEDGASVVLPPLTTRHGDVHPEPNARSVPCRSTPRSEGYLRRSSVTPGRGGRAVPDHHMPDLMSAFTGSRPQPPSLLSYRAPESTGKERLKLVAAASSSTVAPRPLPTHSISAIIMGG
jgi:hypothetical protein